MSDGIFGLNPLCKFDNDKIIKITIDKGNNFLIGDNLNIE